MCTETHPLRSIYGLWLLKRKILSLQRRLFLLDNLNMPDQIMWKHSHVLALLWADKCSHARFSSSLTHHYLNKEALPHMGTERISLALNRVFCLRIKSSDNTSLKSRSTVLILLLPTNKVWILHLNSCRQVGWNKV